MSLQKESEWGERIKTQIEYLGEEGANTPSFRKLVYEAVKSILVKEISNREKEIAEEVPNALHEYARWILTDGKDASPLQRKSKKEEITLSILKH